MNKIPTIALLVLTSGTALAESYYTFSAGWRTPKDQYHKITENIVDIGVIYQCPQGWCIDHEQFRGSLKIPRSNLPYSNDMRNLSNATACQDNSMTTIIGYKQISQPIGMIATNDAITVKIFSRVFSWKINPQDKNQFKISEIKEIINEVEIPLEQPVGDLIQSDTPPRKPKPEELLSTKLDGELNHKDMLTSVDSDWKTSPTSLNFNRFTQSNTDKDLFTLLEPGLQSINQRRKEPINAYHSFRLSAEHQGHLVYQYHEYGHDFNGNGCFDDYGHNKILVPYFNKNSLSGLMFIEYDPNISKSADPMISVGNYRITKSSAGK